MRDGRDRVECQPVIERPNAELAALPARRADESPCPSDSVHVSNAIRASR